MYFRKKILVMFLMIFFALAMCGCQKEKETEEIGQETESEEEKPIKQSGVYITYKVVCEEIPDATDMYDTVNKLQKRAEKYSDKAVVYQDGVDGITVEIPGVSDANEILEELGSPGTLYFIAEMGADGKPNYSQKLVSDKSEGNDIQYTLDKPLEQLETDGSIKLTGTDIANAQAVAYVDATQSHRIAVELTMTDDGSVKLAQATTEAYNGGMDKKTLGIYFDGDFLSVPTVNAEITQGTAIIEGCLNYEEAEKIASFIRIGALKYELKIINVNVIDSSNNSELEGNEVRNEKE